ncbi:hypothetical protein BCR32DRAFT_271421 [Anaeromyces robustus]|uniref:Acyltransferase 3 domain-containing protein n=1 Tax=Anaeromyces robustus TaxID=1754192 RepID=A0A1Y1WRX0_9FUNG|nr:hypothetical protein BCR32DRAFT_271421 [Anaeromyces robustus]|eukprot:ORX76212.1 hypothetical protein BCR32DRAFT_271421 [Anaeromyces robustus]
MEKNMTEKTRTRNYGIDILKMLSMFLVIQVHMLGNGQALNRDPKQINFFAGYYMYIISYSAVDIFAMISGYLIVKSKYSRFKIIPLWLTVFYYSTIITLLFKFVPSLSKMHEVTITELLQSILIPTISERYWYFTAHFCIYFFIPSLNHLICTYSKKQLQELIVTIIVIFTFLPYFNGNKDVFCVEYGYSPLWLASLYIIGAYFRLYPIKISKLKCFGLYLIVVTCTWIPKALTRYHSFFNFSNGIIAYPSIFIVSSAALLLILFSQFEINNKILQKLIVLGSSLSFSVYLIHDNLILHSHYFKDKFIKVKGSNPLIYPFKVLFIVTTIYIICLTIDLIRYYLFKALKINKIPIILIQLLEKKRIEKNNNEKNQDEESTEILNKTYPKSNNSQTITINL